MSLRFERDYGPVRLPQRTDSGHWFPDVLSSHARRVLALRSGRLIGSFCYNVRGRSLYARGTFVSRQARGQGIASRLWDRAIRSERPRTVEVMVCSDRGLALVESLRARYPEIAWKVDEGGGRKLRAKRVAGTYRLAGGKG